MVKGWPKEPYRHGLAGKGIRTKSSGVEKHTAIMIHGVEVPDSTIKEIREMLEEAGIKIVEGREKEFFTKLMSGWVESSIASGEIIDDIRIDLFDAGDVDNYIEQGYLKEE